MPTLTTALPSTGEWAALNLLAIRTLFTASRVASDIMNRTGADPGDLGELAELGWITGHNEDGEDIDLAENWSHSLAHVHLRLTSRGNVWIATNPHNLLLHDLDGTGSTRWMKAAQVKQHDETLRQLMFRRLVTMHTDDGRDLHSGTVPSKQYPNQSLYVRVTRRGQRVVNP